MKTIPLIRAYKTLEECSAVIIAGDEIVSFPGLADLEESDDNEFLYFSWTDEEGLEYNLKFREGDNQYVEAEKSSLFLMDTEGDRVELRILMPMAEIAG